MLVLRNKFTLIATLFLFIIVLFQQLGCGSSTGSGAAKAQTTSGGSGVAGSPGSMSVGDAVYGSFSGSNATISFSGVDSGSTFELLIQSQATDGASKTIGVANLSDDVGKSFGLPDPLDDGPLSPDRSPLQVRFENTLRDEEKLLINVPWSGGASKSVSVSKSSGGDPGISAAVSVNDTDTFRVLTSLTDVTQYAAVTATVKCVNDTVAIYIDDEILSTNPSDLPQSDIDSLCTKYKTALETNISLFGSYPDINSDGVAVALITSQVNRLGTSGGGVITGFFYAGDFFTRSSSIPASNYREIVYLVSPDSAGVYGTKISKAFALSNFLPAVFPHEMQHLISYYQHTVVKGGGSEEDWLNECLSHLAEDLTGYNRENYSRYDLFLASPQSYAIVTSASPSLAQRGGCYLFLRYLYEQSGKSATFLKNLVQTTRTGVTNLVNAYPSSSSDFDELGEFLRRWAIALAYTNRGLTSTSNFVYNGRSYNSSTENWEGVCMVCTAEDGRGTILDGPSFGTYSQSTNYSIKGSATRFLRISSVPASLTLTASGSASPAAIVLRTK